MEDSIGICGWCAEEVHRDHQNENYRVPMHYFCGIRAVVGSIGHMKQECSCFGGTNEDPPGLSKREAARVAGEYFIVHRQRDPRIKKSVKTFLPEVTPEGWKFNGLQVIGGEEIAYYVRNDGGSTLSLSYDLDPYPSLHAGISKGNEKLGPKDVAHLLQLFCPAWDSVRALYMPRFGHFGQHVLHVFMKDDEAMKTK
jgi:hypothetical protein